MTLATLLTCHNRKPKTLACLRSLQGIIDTDIYLVDDASTDGTADAVRAFFPQVRVITGDGNLFWSRGMYTAWREAVKGDYDYYLWLNDDVELYPFFFRELMECMQYGKKHCVVSGLIENAERTQILYGGCDAHKRLVQPNKVPQPITFMNGNVVLIPRCVVEKIGIIDPVFHHDLGDVDYGLRARENGIQVYATRCPVAMGYSNHFCRVRKWDATLKQRFRKLYSPLGSNPRLNFYYRRKHFGLLNATAYFVYLHVLNLLPDVVVACVWGELYKDH